MPALPPVPNVLRIDYHFTIGEDLAAKCREFRGFSPPPSPSATQLNTMAATLAANFAATFGTLMTNEKFLTEIQITDLSSSTSAVGTWSGSHQGTEGIDKTPASACVVMQRRISRRFRGGHSRIYWPFLGAADLNDDQTWGSTGLAALATANGTYSSDLHTAMEAWGNDNGPVTVSYYEGFTPFTGPTGRVRNISKVRLVPLVDNVVGNVFMAGVGSQRKRLLRLA